MEYKFVTDFYGNDFDPALLDTCLVHCTPWFKESKFV